MSGGKVEKNAHLWERVSGEWYVEEPWCAELLFTVEKFVGRIHDPCCGGGNIVKAALAAGYHARGTDRVRRVPEGTEWFLGEVDFLEAMLSKTPAECVNVVMNPPYERALGTERFINHALTQATGKVAAFVPTTFLNGGKRGRGLYRENVPHRAWIHSDRPSCPPGEYLEAGGKAEGGTEDFMWLVWDLTAPPAQFTQTGWIAPDDWKKPR